MVTITVLMDNHALIDRYFLAEPALSILVEADGKKILFDTGYSGSFLSNANRMGHTLLDLTHVVISHGHLDHTGGLVHLARHLSEAQIEGRSFTVPNLIAHPHAFFPRPKPPLPDIGSVLSPDRLGMHFRLKTSTRPLWLTDTMVFLGEIPRRFSFEKTDPGVRKIVLPDGRIVADQLLDDTALAFRSRDGLILITGCSHAGICNITEYAREICGEHEILDIIGGFHLMHPAPEQMSGTCAYLKAIDPHTVHACHCTSLSSLVMLSSVCRLAEVGVGLRLNYV